MPWRRPPLAADPWEPVLGLLFPEGLDERHAAQIAAETAGPVTPAAVRRVLGAFDQQDQPSSVTVRWGPTDLRYVDVRGVRLALDTADASVSVQIADGGYEPHIVAMIDRHLGPGDVFVDVGANIGYHTVIGATRVGRSGRVIAVEANAENARLIAHTVESNGLDQVTVLPIALADAWGSLTFGSHVGSNGGFLDPAVATSGRGTVVPTIPLDDVGIEGVSLVKIDVEGAEALVIDGAVELIARDRPNIVMELSVEMTRRVSGREPREHLGRFLDWGYSIAIIDRASGAPRDVASLDEMLEHWGELTRIEDLLLTPAPR